MKKRFLTLLLALCLMLSIAPLAGAEDLPSEPEAGEVVNTEATPPPCVPGLVPHETELRSAREPDCTHVGYSGNLVCKVCGLTVEMGMPLAALGHQWVEKSEGLLVCSVCGAEKAVFTDVPSDAYFAEAVEWAIRQDPKITTGTSATTFSPYDTCTRAQVVTFLWRAAGEPEPEITANPFRDVNQGDYYYAAVLWAVDIGITKGVSETEFAPNDPCTRAQVVTFLWRATPASTLADYGDMTVYITKSGEKYHVDPNCKYLRKSKIPTTLDSARARGYKPCSVCANGIPSRDIPAPVSTPAPTPAPQPIATPTPTPARQTVAGFTDVFTDQYYTSAVIWAVAQGITTGTSDTTFEPDSPCTRAQIVTFIWRAIG